MAYIESYIESDKISVFPSALRAAENGNYASGKFTSEYNLTGIIKTIADRDSFIIEWNTENGNAEFVINGYYFKVVGGDISTPTGDLYAIIHVDDSSHRLCNTDGSGYINLDNNGNFEGVLFDSNEQTGSTSSEGGITYTSYSLQIYSGGELIQDNFHKFNASRIFSEIGNEVLDLQALLEDLSSSGLLNGGNLSPARGGTGRDSFIGDETDLDQFRANSAVITGANINAPFVTRNIVNNTTATEATGNYYLITQNTLLNATAKINNSQQTSAVSVYAPTSGGTDGYILKANGSTSAPTWVQAVPVTSGGTGRTSLGSGYLLAGSPNEGTSGYGRVQYTNSNIGGTVVLRDSNGNFSAGTITANLTGTASMAIEATKATQDGAGNPITSTYVPKNGTTMTGKLVAQNSTDYTKQVRNITLSTNTASGGSNGDIWITYSD